MESIINNVKTISDILAEIRNFIGDCPETIPYQENKVCPTCGQPFNKSKQVIELQNLIRTQVEKLIDSVPSSVLGLERDKLDNWKKEVKK